MHCWYVVEESVIVESGEHMPSRTRLVECGAFDVALLPNSQSCLAHSKRILGAESKAIMMPASVVNAVKRMGQAKYGQTVDIVKRDASKRMW